MGVVYVFEERYLKQLEALESVLDVLVSIQWEERKLSCVSELRNIGLEKSFSANLMREFTTIFLPIVQAGTTSGRAVIAKVSRKPS